MYVSASGSTLVSASTYSALNQYFVRVTSKVWTTYHQNKLKFIWSYSFHQPGHFPKYFIIKLCQTIVEQHPLEELHDNELPIT